MVTEPTSRVEGLQFMMKSEKGEHLQMDLLELHKVTAGSLCACRRAGGSPCGVPVNTAYAACAW